jgi:hypothetical protein
VLPPTALASQRSPKTAPPWWPLGYELAPVPDGFATWNDFYRQLGVPEDTDDLDLEHLVGGLYSAIPVQRLPPPDQRADFTEQVRRAVAPHERFTEPVRVRMLLGRPPQT